MKMEGVITINKNIKELENWLISSDILNKNGEIKDSTNNGYSWRTRNYKYVYNEITGYSVSTFVYLYKVYNDKKYLKLAQNAAKYLLKIQDLNKNSDTYGAVFYGFKLPEITNLDVYYTFDNFIIIQGLCDLYSVDENLQYLENAELIADWIIKKMLKDNGSYFARYDRKNETKQWITGKFAGDNGVLHAKGAIALLKLYGYTHNNTYKKIAEKTLNWALDLQDNNGSFWANEKKEYLFSHAHCYVCEGLVYAYHKLQKKRYLDALENALEFSRVKLNKDGSLYHIYNDRKLWRKVVFGTCPYKTTDATSQYIRLVILLSYIKQDKAILERYRIADSINFILDNQVLNSSDKNRLYALHHKICDRFGFKVISPIMSTWCVQFSVQAIFEYHYYNIDDNKRFQTFIEYLY